MSKKKYEIRKVKEGVFYVTERGGNGFPIAIEKTQKKAEGIVKAIRNADRKKSK